MASQFQNRLVGSIILVALAVIILPELFDGKKAQQQQAFEAMPLQPETDVDKRPVQPIKENATGTPINTGTANQNNNDTVVIDQAPEMNANAESTAIVKQGPANEPLDQAGWVIQLGVFQNQESVDKLVEQLKTKGYDAYRESYSLNGKQFNRLLVGPSLTKSELEQQLDDLQKLTDLAGRIRRFEP